MDVRNSSCRLGKADNRLCLQFICQIGKSDLLSKNLSSFITSYNFLCYNKRIMKKFFIIFTLLFLPLCSFAQEEISLDIQEEQNLVPDESLLDYYNPDFDVEVEKNNLPDISKPQELTTEHTSFLDRLSKNTKDIYKLQIENTDVPSCLFKDALTFEIDKGPVEEIHLWTVVQSRYDGNIQESGETTNLFKVGLINSFIEGKFKGGKESFRIMLDPTPQNDRPFMQNLFQDVYIETKRIPHHRILVGNSRPKVGYEGASSAFTLPFINRSQISRHFGTVRKTGVRVMGDYSLVDYDLGGYLADTYFSEFFSGGEFDGWVNLKPLGKTDGKYGDLTLGGGIVAGSRHSTNFFVASTYLGYKYKNFWMRAEYADANGSNGLTGLTDKHRHGWYVTLGYKITKKLEAVLRYDDFNPDENIRDNNTREYSAGINYYLKGQALRLILNYVFCQNQAGPDSHRIMVGTQIAI